MIPRELLKALRRIEIVTKHLATDQLVGSFGSVFKGQGLAFHEVRQYQHGDDVRTIDWNVSARSGETWVKVFVEERELSVMLVVDVSRSQLFGTRQRTKARLAAEVAALCAFSAIRNNDRVGLILGSDRVERIIPPRKGQSHVLRLTREILAHEPTGRGTRLSTALETLVKVARRRSVAFVLSDFFDAGYERALALAAARHDVIPVLLADPRDGVLPDVGLTWLEDLESGQDVLIDTSSARVREQVRRRAEAHREGTLRTLRKLGLDVVEMWTDRPYVRPLQDLFARRQRRARR